MVNELARLGLEDRSDRLVAGRGVWDEITPLFTPQHQLRVAVAHLTGRASELLPLKKGDLLIVDAGDTAVLAGQTDPAVLLEWVAAGVVVHSLPGLNAKMVIAEGERPFVTIGSADGSASSDGEQFEAVVVSHEEQTVVEARKAWMSWREQAGEPLTRFALEALREGYPEDARETPRRPVAPVADPVLLPQPVAQAAVPVAEVEPLTVDETREVHWPKPDALYLAKLTETDTISAEAQAKHKELSAQHAVDTGNGRWRVDMFWWDQAPGESFVYQVDRYVVPVYANKIGRVSVKSPVGEPGRVLYFYEDSWHRPTRTYYYVLVRESAAKPLYSDLKNALSSIGQKPDFTIYYMIASKVNALLTLWPDLEYPA
jgi:hypothetical protein